MPTKEEVDQLPAVKLLRKAAICLYLELPSSIADDVKQKVEDAIDALRTTATPEPAAAEVATYTSIELTRISGGIERLHAHDRELGALLRRFFNDATRGKQIEEVNCLTAPAHAAQ